MFLTTMVDTEQGTFPYRGSSSLEEPTSWPEVPKDGREGNSTLLKQKAGLWDLKFLGWSCILRKTKCNSGTCPFYGLCSHYHSF